MTTAIHSVVPPSNPFLEKFNESHIEQILGQMGRRQDQIHELCRSNRWFLLAAFLVAILALGAVTFLQPGNPALADDLVKMLLGFAGGVGAGYGLKSRAGH